MGRSAEEYSLDEPIGAVLRDEAAGRPLAGNTGSAPGSFQHSEIEGICANPLADEPHPMVIGAVKRFGLVGLVACALGSGLLRWWRSLNH